MPDPITAVVAGGTTIAGGVIGSKAAKRAANAQADAAGAGIDETRRQFDFMTELLQPFVDVGEPALTGQKNLIGLNGYDAQRSAVMGINDSPLFQAYVKSGEDALLQRASATGGLRGGNIQAALAQFRPEMLRAEIENQYAKLGGLTSLGQQSAAGVGTAGQAAGANIASLLNTQGAARAGGILGSANAITQSLGNAASLVGAAGRFGLF